MSYMNCPRCGLSVYLEAGQAPWELCPRCLGQAEVAVPIYISEQGLARSEPVPAGDAGAEVPAEHRLTMTSSRSPDGARVTLSGELDLATFSQLGSLLAALELDHPPRLLLDLRELSFLDSTGLATVVAADLRAQTAGRRLELMCSDGPVRRLLQLTGLEDTLTFV